MASGACSESKDGVLFLAGGLAVALGPPGGLFGGVDAGIQVAGGIRIWNPVDLPRMRTDHVTNV